MSIVRARSHSSNAAGWQSDRGKVNTAGGGSGDENYEGLRKIGWRRDSLPSSLDGGPGNCSPISAANGAKFPMTPAEFNLFPPSSSVGNTRKPQDATTGKRHCLGLSHLTTLRTAAFWELRRSIVENGEGLIHRMRDYERSRLRLQVRQKAKERKKRVRKSSFLRSGHRTLASISEASDEDDVLICSVDASKELSRRSPLVTRARSFDSMDVDRQGQEFLAKRPETIQADSETVLFYPDSTLPTPNSSSVSLPLHQSLFMDPNRLLVPPSISTEQALAELNVAFANGACCISDYSPIWMYQQQFKADEQDSGHGDLWR